MTQQTINFDAAPEAAVAQVGDTIQDGPWDGFQVISAYTRRQAIEDGVLVQLSGPGYEGDEWVPKMVAEAGFVMPVAMTVGAFMECVAPTPAAERACNDIQGRLWDVLWMLKQAIRASRTGGEVLLFKLSVVRDRVRPTLTTLKCVCGPDDDGRPCLTIMFPHED